MFKFQKGFTLMELVVVCMVLASLGIGGGFIYILCHFIAKVW